MDREAYMRMAISLAEEAAAAGEVPVGCVIADAEGRVIGRGRNRREEQGSAVAHAEIEAISEACRALGGWRLDGCALYSARGRRSAAAAAASSTCSPSDTDTVPPSTAACWNRNVRGFFALFSKSSGMHGPETAYCGRSIRCTCQTSMNIV